MEISQLLDKRYKCKYCKTNSVICESTPLHVMFKFLQYTKDGKNLSAYMYGADGLYTVSGVYQWFYDGYNGTNLAKINYEKMTTYYEGIVYNLGVSLRHK